MAARSPRYKLHYNRLTDEVVLYDLTEDPGERVDVADQHPETARALREELAEFMRVDEHGPPLSLDLEEVERLKSLGYFP